MTTILIVLMLFLSLRAYLSVDLSEEEKIQVNYLIDSILDDPLGILSGGRKKGAP